MEGLAHNRLGEIAQVLLELHNERQNLAYYAKGDFTPGQGLQQSFRQLRLRGRSFLLSTLWDHVKALCLSIYLHLILFLFGIFGQ